MEKKECIIYSSIGRKSTSEEKNSHDSAECTEQGSQHCSWIYKQEKYFGDVGNGEVIVNIQYRFDLDSYFENQVDEEDDDEEEDDEEDDDEEDGESF